MVALAILAVAGFGCWIYQLMNGLGVTGMSNITSWGLYIIMFMFFVGLSAGGLIVASSASVFGIGKYKKVAKPAVILSTVCICVAAAFVLIDLGGVQRFWRLFTGPNFMSPLMWDVCVITVYLIINILYLVWMGRGDEDKVKVLSRAALPVAILVHSVTAWILGLQIAKAWYTAIMAPIFVASALDSGLALLLLALIGLDAAGIFRLPEDVRRSLAGLLATCIAIDAFFIGCEILTMAYPGASEVAVLSQMVSGATAPFFWFEILFGLVIPFCILVIARNRENKTAIIVSSILVVLGVAAKRVWLILSSFIVPNVIGAPGITLGTSSAVSIPSPDIWSILGSYAPTLPEIMIVLGVVSLGVLVFIALSKRLLDPDTSEKAAPELSARVAEAQ